MITFAEDISCNCVTITPSGGTAPYTYSFDGDDFQASNTYCVTTGATIALIIVDSLGEVLIDTVTLFSPLDFTCEHTQPVCNGDTGTITVTVNNPGAFLIDLDNGTQTSITSPVTFVGVPAGMHDVVITNANCEDNCLVRLIDPPLLEFTHTYDCDENLVITATGGVLPYEYKVDVGGTYQYVDTFESVVAGNYDLYVRDANGCEVTTNETLVCYEVLCPAVVDTLSTCTNGQVTITASGGVAPYTYTLGGVTQASGVFTGLSAMNYQYIVEDDDGNICMDEITVGGVDPLQATVNCVDDDCCQTFKEVFDVSITSGQDLPSTANPLPTNTDDIDVFFQGQLLREGTDYTVSGNTITSLRDWTNATITVKYKYNNGASLYVTGGTAPYTYTLNGGASTPYTGGTISMFTGLNTFVVTDDNGCTVTVAANYPCNTLVVTVLSIGDASCDCVGSVELSASGGVAPYQYSLDGVTYQYTSSFADLCAGALLAYVKDAAGQIQTIPVIIADGGAPSFTAVIDCATLTITATGGTAPYTYSTGGVFVTGNVFTLPNGIYTVTVKDSLGCTFSATTEIACEVECDCTELYITHLINDEYYGLLTASPCDELEVCIETPSVTPDSVTIYRNGSVIGSGVCTTIQMGVDAELITFHVAIGECIYIYEIPIQSTGYSEVISVLNTNGDERICHNDNIVVTTADAEVFNLSASDFEVGCQDVSIICETPPCNCADFCSPLSVGVGFRPLPNGDFIMTVTSLGEAIEVSAPGGANLHFGVGVVEFQIQPSQTLWVVSILSGGCQYERLFDYRTTGFITQGVIYLNTISCTDCA